MQFEVFSQILHGNNLSCIFEFRDNYDSIFFLPLVWLLGLLTLLLCERQRLCISGEYFKDIDVSEQTPVTLDLLAAGMEGSWLGLVDQLKVFYVAGHQ
jgi:hypothetical protein